MWIRKSQQEMMKEQRVRRFGAGLGVICGALLLFVFGLPHAGFHIPLALRIVALLTSGVIFLAWYQRAHWRRAQSSVWVCDRCNVVNSKKDDAKCACGGQLRSLNEMKWLEVAPSQEFPSTPPDTQNALRIAGAH
jgi:hypothetical protein